LEIEAENSIVTYCENGNQINGFPFDKRYKGEDEQDEDSI
jgi:hypothetical protein